MPTKEAAELQHSREFVEEQDAAVMRQTPVAKGDFHISRRSTHPDLNLTKSDVKVTMKICSGSPARSVRNSHPMPFFTPDSGYKDRWQWFHRRASYPLRDAPPLDLEKFWEHRDQFQNVRGLNWDKAGPLNYAGRVTSLVVDPHNPDKLFAGSAAGGVWRTDDGGKSW